MISSKRSNEFNAALIERLLFRVSKKWIAGYTAQEALLAAQDTNKSGMFPILNYLGEEIKDEVRIDRTVFEYLDIIDLLYSNKVSGAVSVKPTQIGLAVDADLLSKNLGEFQSMPQENAYSSGLTWKLINMYRTLFQLI